MLSLSGHSSFPFCFGILSEQAIVMELFAISKQPGWEKESTLSTAIKVHTITCADFCNVLKDLVSAYIHMHSKKILHNDIKANNVILCSNGRVVVIDFGKATLLTHPLVYNIIPGSDDAKIYNTQHRHLAHELRNKPGTKQSPLTDAYSIGHMIKYLCPYIPSSEKVLQLASKLKCIEPCMRLTLANALDSICNDEMI